MFQRNTKPGVSLSFDDVDLDGEDWASASASSRASVSLPPSSAGSSRESIAFYSEFEILPPSAPGNLVPMLLPTEEDYLHNAITMELLKVFKGKICPFTIKEVKSFWGDKFEINFQFPRLLGAANVKKDDTGSIGFVANICTRTLGMRLETSLQSRSSMRQIGSNPDCTTVIFTIDKKAVKTKLNAEFAQNGGPIKIIS
jgi:hypothetical protein